MPDNTQGESDYPKKPDSILTELLIKVNNRTQRFEDDERLIAEGVEAIEALLLQAKAAAAREARIDEVEHLMADLERANVRDSITAFMHTQLNDHLNSLTKGIE
jgi:hypothetical protein